MHDSAKRFYPSFFFWTYGRNSFHYNLSNYQRLVWYQQKHGEASQEKIGLAKEEKKNEARQSVKRFTRCAMITLETRTYRCNADDVFSSKGKRFAELAQVATQIHSQRLDACTE